MNTSALTWAIKDSLVAYISDLDDGELNTSSGATRTDDGFAFEHMNVGDFDRTTLSGTLAFRGTVTLRGHGGMLNIVVTDPCVVLENGTGEVRVAQPGATDGRQLGIAKLGATLEGETLTCTAHLTVTGVNVLGPQYMPGAEIASLRIQLS